MIDSITAIKAGSNLRSQSLTPHALKSLSDDELWSRTARVADREKCATLELLDHLLEVDARRLYAKRAFTSIFAYVTEALGYSESQASERIGAMRLMRDLEGVKTKVESGSLTLTSAAAIQRTLRKSGKLLGAIVSKEEQARIVKECEHKTSREVERVLASHFPENVTYQEKIRPVTAEFDELRFVIDRETRELLDELRTIRGEESLAEVFKEALKVRLNKLRRTDPQTTKSADEKRTPKAAAPKATEPERSTEDILTPAKFTWAPTLAAKSDRPKTSSTRATVDQSKVSSKRYIPAQIRVQVRVRSQNRCEYEDKQTNRRCLSQAHLQFEHRQPFAKGGAHTTQNILHFCSEHNRLRAIEEFGAIKMSRYLNR